MWAHKISLGIFEAAATNVHVAMELLTNHAIEAQLPSGVSGIYAC